MKYKEFKEFIEAMSDWQCLLEKVWDKIVYIGFPQIKFYEKIQKLFDCLWI